MGVPAFDRLSRHRGVLARQAPTRAPEAKCCSFQIGTSALRVLIKCAHAASASPR